MIIGFMAMLLVAAAIGGVATLFGFPFWPVFVVAFVCECLGVLLASKG